MKSLALDSTGDLLIQNNQFQMVDGNELLRQKVQEVLSTKKGEWFYDWEQGIEFSQLLGKNVTEESVRSEIEDGLRQVDESLYISDFSMKVEGRTLIVDFTAADETSDTKISVTTKY